jgi:hypothetical protein
LARIRVQRVDDRTFRVVVTGGRTTEHTVTVDPDYHERLTGGRVTQKLLVEKSFEFLLERENNTSIMGVFDLSVIRRYFPEYEERVRQSVGGGG